MSIHLSGLALPQHSTVEVLKKPYLTVFYNNENGLPQNTVFDIEKDDFGFLWIATEEGMVRYDGSTFTEFNKENNSEIISNIYYDVHKVDNEGVWAASDNSLVLFNKRIKKVIDAREIIDDNVISSISKDNFGRLWIGTLGDLLYYLEDDEIKAFKPWTTARGRKIQVIDVAGDKLLVGTNQGLYQIDLRSLKISITPETETFDIITILPDGNDYLFGTKNHGIHHFSENKLKAHNLNEEHKNSFVNNIALNENNVLWAGIEEKGLFVSEKNKFTKIDIEGIDENLIRIIFIDGDHVWLGTNGLGMIHLKPASLKMLEVKNNPITASIFPIYQHSNGDAFAGTFGKGFYHMNEKDTVLYNAQNGLTDNTIASIYGRGNKIYIGTYGGINSFDLTTRKIDPEIEINKKLKGRIATAVYRDLNNQIWIITENGGVHILNEEEEINLIEIPEKFSHTDLVTILEDSRKRIWLGSFATGMLSIENYTQVSEFQLTKDIKSKVIFSIYEDPQGDLWLATESGLIYFDHQKFIEVKSHNGISSQAIYAIQDDGLGHVWLSTNSGLLSLPIDDLLSFKENTSSNFIRSKSFNRSHGMANSETNGNCFPSAVKLANGNLWFPSIKGIVVVDLDLVSQRSEAPNILIEGIWIGDTFFDHQSKIEIPAGTFKFDIDFTSIDFDDTENTQYYYRFKNQSASLIALGNRKEISLTSIEPGIYTVEILAYKSGKWSEPAEITFKVQGFFHDTIYFQLLIFILVFILGALSIIYFKKLRASKNLEEKVKIRTADLEKSSQALEIALRNIENQNTKLKEITWLQSHVVRAPLTRVMGLAHLLKNHENYKYNHKSKAELILELEDGLLELDDIIREIHLKAEKIENL
ncbi:ligand-binding sensor domain-containing protein [Belliella aquatica]|uniref:Two component regulator three Y domain-containing protein n=1 Tax=Belliella aquatica TaxID=1323734 RepID=A0ABQ1N224_9BACT|nr:two-component regulator propeller domain-containing protein [Belliella aquatica]GGC49441.1 hypothetical protein GCM10010993_29900 [Belliella aquatica]